MRSGGDFLLEDIAYFNGGLFEHVEVLELVPGEIDALLAASRMDWSAIEPSILGTLFERGLDPKIRAPLGANYTDPGTIMKLVRPVVVDPLEREWEAAKARIAPLVEKYHAGGKGSQKAGQEAQALFLGYLERLNGQAAIRAGHHQRISNGRGVFLALRQYRTGRTSRCHAVRCATISAGGTGLSARTGWPDECAQGCERAEGKARGSARDRPAHYRPDAF